MAEIAKTPGGGELAQLVLAAQQDHIQAERRARRQQVVDPPVLAVAHRQHAHLQRHVAVQAVVVDHALIHALGGDQLAHQPIVIDVDIVDQAEDLVTFAHRRLHQRAKGRSVELRNPAADHKAGRAGAQQASNRDGLSHTDFPPLV